MYPYVSLLILYMDESFPLIIGDIILLIILDSILALFLRTSITNNILVVEMEELEKVKVEE